MKRMNQEDPILHHRVLLWRERLSEAGRISPTMLSLLTVIGLVGILTVLYFFVLRPKPLPEARELGPPVPPASRPR